MPRFGQAVEVCKEATEFELELEFHGVPQLWLSAHFVVPVGLVEGRGANVVAVGEERRLILGRSRDPAAEVAQRARPPVAPLRQNIVRVRKEESAHRGGPPLVHGPLGAWGGNIGAASEGKNEGCVLQAKPLVAAPHLVVGHVLLGHDVKQTGGVAHGHHVALRGRRAGGGW